MKKLIKHATVRRRVMGDKLTTHGKKATEQSTEKRWKQTFRVGFVEQAFKRSCVREALRHGTANAAFSQRRDTILRTTGTAGTHKKKFKEVAMRPMVDLCREILDADAAATTAAP